MIKITKEIIERNIKIANFMDVSYIPTPSDLLYHISWNALMPVWKKIIGLEGITLAMYQSLYFDCSNAIKNVNIEMAHDRISQLIRFREVVDKSGLVNVDYEETFEDT